jgi:hypothetical protein
LIRGIPAFRDALEEIWGGFDPEDIATPASRWAVSTASERFLNDRRAFARAVNPKAGHSTVKPGQLRRVGLCYWWNNSATGFLDPQETVDIQYLIKGIEGIDVASVGTLGEPTVFKPESDIQKFASRNDPVTQLLLHPGEFVIVLPGAGLARGQGKPHSPPVQLDLHTRNSSFPPPRDSWIGILFFLHLATVWAFVPFFPGQLIDPDLLAYFIYFREWMDGSGGLRGLEFFNHPKPLMILLLGPLGNVLAAAMLTSVVTGILGVTVYLIGKMAFGRAAGILWSLVLLGDPSRTFLALKSSADLYLTALLFLSIWFFLCRRYAFSAFGVLLAALIKPVALPCLLQFLWMPGGDKRRWWYFGLPLLALPATLFMNQWLLGGVFHSASYLEEFAALRGLDGMKFWNLPYFVFWTLLVDFRFGITLLLAVAGVLWWISRNRKRLKSPLLLMSALFFGGYLGLACITSYMPFFRFFWPLEVWSLGFMAFTAVEVGRLAGRGNSRIFSFAATSLLIAVIFFNFLKGFSSYIKTFAIPMERDRAFVKTAVDTLARDWGSKEILLAPLVFQPQLMWFLPGGSEPNTIFASEIAASNARDQRPPTWILDVPSSYLSGPARSFVSQLTHSGRYAPILTDDAGTIYLLKDEEATAIGRQE